MSLAQFFSLHLSFTLALFSFDYFSDDFHPVYYSLALNFIYSTCVVPLSTFRTGRWLDNKSAPDILAPDVSASDFSASNLSAADLSVSNFWHQTFQH